ncbi:Glyoxylate reductase [Lachnellula suecica]|uniref:Glyoxylate reductase n=1 Tax=Lachnellula suecica TaxID=602035 RepID=A0A8T9C1V9_9HELO|nr:Glyoxylate reductase [Lachnellula suecica]
MTDTTNTTGHLLCLLPFPEPLPLTDRIKKQHHQLKFSYRQFTIGADWKASEGLPDEIWKDVTVLFTLTQYPRDMKLAPNLQLVQIFSTGTDHISKLPVYTDSTVPITNAAGVPAPVIAEWVIMTILVATRKYNTLRDWQLSRTWDNGGKGKGLFSSSPSTLGKRIGIIGYGGIGRQVANIARAMGMEVFAYTANPRTSPESKRYTGYSIPNTGDADGSIPSQWFHGTDKNSLHEFLGQGIDYLLLSLPLTKLTPNLLGEAEFDILSKRNTFIINISRGEVIDQDSLIKALRAYEEDSSGVHGQGRKGLSGAALDVAVPEPLPKDHPLWGAPNCIITPHISGLYSDYGGHVFQVLEMNLQRLAGREKFLNLIDRETGYSSAVEKN